MSGDESRSRTPERVDRMLFGALAGLSVAVVLQLIDKQTDLDTPIFMALLCFSVALPLLVSSFLLEVAATGKVKRAPRMLFDLTGVILALAGFALMFFHLHLLAGGIFLASMCFCFIVVVSSLR